MGIDGDTNSSLIQAGTEQDWGPQGVLYYAWYEILPSVSIELGAVSPGDLVSADIVKDGPGTWSITVDDSTEGSLWTGSVSYSTPEASAEWIEEAPTDSGTGNVELLADYGRVQFSDMGVQGPGTGTAVASPVYMVKQGSSNVVQSYPAPYSRSTDSFNLTYGTPEALPTAFPAVPIVTGATPTTGTTTTTGRRPRRRLLRSPRPLPAPRPVPGPRAGWRRRHPHPGDAVLISARRPRVLARGDRTEGFSPLGMPPTVVPPPTWSPGPGAS